MKNIEQKYTSANTSINTVSAVYKLIDTPNTVILDYGGGKYDTNAEYKLQKCNSRVLVFDPYNRTPEHNSKVIQYFKLNPAKIVVCSNVLCVIKEDEIILDILGNIRDLMDYYGILYIRVYERDKTGVGCRTTKGWQRNQCIESYIPFIQQVFGENCEIKKYKGCLLVKKTLKK